MAHDVLRSQTGLRRAAGHKRTRKSPVVQVEPVDRAGGPVSGFARADRTGYEGRNGQIPSIDISPALLPSSRQRVKSYCQKSDNPVRKSQCRCSDSMRFCYNRPMRFFSSYGGGWWLDRRRHRYLPIIDHTRTALEHPRRFRLRAADVTAIRAAGSVFEHQRQVAIPLIASRGFLRIRWIPRQSTLGWQFHDDPAGALASLRRFAARHGLGPAIEVTFTDFASGRERRALLADLLRV